MAGARGCLIERGQRAEIRELKLAPIDDGGALAMGTARFRDIYNRIRPHQSLGPTRGLRRRPIRHPVQRSITATLDRALRDAFAGEGSAATRRAAGCAGGGSSNGPCRRRGKVVAPS